MSIFSYEFRNCKYGGRDPKGFCVLGEKRPVHGGDVAFGQPLWAKPLGSGVKMRIAV
jgi:hypothetical protein